MKKLADYGTDDHPADDPERVPISWIVVAMDDCTECEDLRVELTVEEVGKQGAGLVGHLAPDSAAKAPGRARDGAQGDGRGSGALTSSGLARSPSTRTNWRAMIGA